MGWQEACARCGDPLPHRTPLIVETRVDDGHATPHSLKAFCSECRGIVLSHINRVVRCLP